MSLAQKTQTMPGILRSFAILSSYYLQLGRGNIEATEDSLKLLNEAIYVLENYDVNNFVKMRVLGNYLEALRRQERHFEAEEIFQLLCNIKVSDEDVESEMMFTPSYFM